MKRKRFTEEQIIGVLKQAEAGAKTAQLCRQVGITPQTFYRWKAKYGGMKVSDAKRPATWWSGECEVSVGPVNWWGFAARWCAIKRRRKAMTLYEQGSGNWPWSIRAMATKRCTPFSRERVW